MKVVHISTGVSNSSACVKLHNALLDSGIESWILARNVDNDIKNTTELGKGTLLQRAERKAEELHLDSLKKNKEYPFNTGFLGYDLSVHPKVMEADVIHIHWICGLLSMEQLAKLTKLGKPLFWTCHDIWPVTGGCHIEEGLCENVTGRCQECPYMKSDILVQKVKNNKIHWLKNLDITYIAPSNWMASTIKASQIYGGQEVKVIPNALDTSIFHEKRDDGPKDKMNILFGATSTKLPYRGFRYLEELLLEIKEATPDIFADIRINLVGQYDYSSQIIDEADHLIWGTIDGPEKMAEMYCKMDVLVYPSLADNLPGVVAEALACEVPVLAFDIGGISDLVEHKENGFLAKRGDVAGLLRGLQWIMEHNQDNCLGKAGRAHIMELMDPKKIVEEHISIYERS